MGQRQTTNVFNPDRITVYRNGNYRNNPLPVQLNGLMDQSTWKEAMNLLEPVSLLITFFFALK